MVGGRASLVRPCQQGAVLEEERGPPLHVDRRRAVVHTHGDIDAVPRTGDPWTEAKGEADAAPRTSRETAPAPIVLRVVGGARRGDRLAIAADDSVARSGPDLSLLGGHRLICGAAFHPGFAVFDRCDPSARAGRVE
jgi:hypothetical protein